ncbi:MAG: SelB C-terminal domain-containing protein [Candidatus Neomarinimicrobiota bacterium]
MRRIRSGDRSRDGGLETISGATVAELKELLQTSRKWVIPLLNYYDRTGLTRQEGDVRKHECMIAWMHE